MSSVFGDVFIASQIEEAAQATLQKWFPRYLRWIEKKLSLEVGSIEDPITFNSRNTTDLIPGEQLPKCVVISPGIAGKPVADGAGVYRATWNLSVGVAFVDEDEQTARLKVDCYGAAARLILLHKRIEGVKIVNIEWTGESYQDLDLPGKVQQLKAAIVHFTVDIGNVASKRSKGPASPTDDIDDYGAVATIGINYVKEPIDA